MKNLNFPSPKCVYIVRRTLWRTEDVKKDVMEDVMEDFMEDDSEDCGWRTLIILLTFGPVSGKNIIRIVR